MSRSDESDVGFRLDPAEPSTDASPSHPEQPLELLPAVREGRYAIEGEIGRGGLGRVLRARDGVLDRPVALKELLDRDEDSARRFVREAMITARLEHPGIVPVHDAARWPSGDPFIAMKLVSGRPLSELIREARTLEARLAFVPNVLAVSEAVAYAHEKRIIHRDIKPANVMVGAFGETILIDWGLTKDLDAPSESVPERAASWGSGAEASGAATIAGSILGTPAYMSPEQARGDAVDERSDVYALGAMLYEVLSGIAPHAGTSAQQLLERAVRAPPPPIQEREPAVPSDLSAIVAKSMSSAPRDRYANGGELAADLKRFLTGQVVGAKRYTRGELLSRWVRRNRVAVGLSLALIATAAIGGTIAILRVIEARDRAEVAMHGAEDARRAEADRADDLVIVQARSMLDRDPTAAIAWLGRLSPESERSSAARTLALDARLRGVAEVIDPALDRIRSLSISERGDHIAVLGGEDTIRWWSFGALEARSMRVPGNAAFLELDASGTRLVVRRDRGIDVLDEAGKRIFSAEVPWAVQGEKEIVSIARDGRTAATGGDEIRVWDLERGTTRRIPGKTYFVALSAHGRYLAASGDDGALRIFDLARDQELALERRNRSLIRHLAFSANEAYLATTGGDLLLWDLATGKATELAGHEGAVWDVALSSDGRRALSSGFDRTVRAWNLAEGVSTIAARDVLTTRIRFAPDGIHAAFASGDVLSVVDTETFARRELRGHHGPISDFELTPDGKRVITAGADGVLRVWDLTISSVQSLRGAIDLARGFTLSRAGWIAIPGEQPEVRVRSLDGATFRDLGRMEGGVASALFSPSGDQLAVAGGSGTVTIYDPAGGTSKVLGSVPAGLQLRAFDGEGRLLARSAEGSVLAWPLAGGARRELCPHLADEGATVVAGGNGRWIAAGVRDARSVFGRSGPEVAVCDTKRGELFRLSEHSAPVRSLALGNTLPLLAVGTDDGAIRIWDLETRASRLFGAHGGAVRALLFSADDALLAAGGSDGRLEVHALYDRSSIALESAGSDVVSLDFSPREDLLAAAGTDGIARVFSLATREMRVLHGATGVERVAFSPDGRWIVAASTSGAIKIFSDDAPREASELHAWISAQTRAQIRGDGRLAGVRLSLE